MLFAGVEHPPFEGGKPGPPHSIERAEVDRLFGEDAWDTATLKREGHRMPLEPSWRERAARPPFETTYLLTRGFILRSATRRGG